MGYGGFPPPPPPNDLFSRFLKLLGSLFNFVTAFMSGNIPTTIVTGIAFLEEAVQFVQFVFGLLGPRLEEPDRNRLERLVAGLKKQGIDDAHTALFGT
ncbi:hypothetical protein ACE41H_15755 [Paenibacillus enshidis]|uniref:Uncharacterized protein n=1 Tax=Paenibacillus enshidis TaxID=1458439 RepID=A0ABV5AVH5_9BACL